MTMSYINVMRKSAKTCDETSTTTIWSWNIEVNARANGKTAIHRPVNLHVNGTKCESPLPHGNQRSEGEARDDE